MSGVHEGDTADFRDMRKQRQLYVSMDDGFLWMIESHRIPKVEEFFWTTESLEMAVSLCTVGSSLMDDVVFMEVGPLGKAGPCGKEDLYERLDLWGWGALMNSGASIE